MSQEFTLPLSGLNCGRCIAKVEQALSTNTDISQYFVTKTELTLTTSLSKQHIIEIISQLGYSVPEEKVITLYLAGLNCGKCVKKTTEALETLSHSTILSISKAELNLNTIHSTENVVSLIKSIGFHASTIPLCLEDKSSEESDNKAITSKPEILEPNTTKTTQLILSGMTCASCVASVEKIISDTNNVQSVRVNLAERTALVTGDINEMEVIQAIEKGGYGAEISLNEEQRRERQKELYLKTTTAHKKNTITSLAIGAPLMLWGVFGGNMKINTVNDQLTWGVVGLICLGLLLTAGRHFFVNAWKAFTHHRATMDTLVALGTGSAWLYSMALVISPEFFPEQARHVYFEATA
ncbi:cation transporter, partial [Aliivibrio sifiae]